MEFFETHLYVPSSAGATRRRWSRSRVVYALTSIVSMRYLFPLRRSSPGNVVHRIKIGREIWRTSSILSIGRKRPTGITIDPSDYEPELVISGFPHILISSSQLANTFSSLIRKIYRLLDFLSVVF